MQEKELRIAVVLTGGISLAIYMHGIAKELHKLVRASRAFHRSSSEDAYTDSTSGREVDTETLYHELLKSLAPKMNLRIVIDVIAGASAGGVNGIMLARALAHDLDMDPHRRIWLERADVDYLVDETSAASRWRQIYMTPFTALLSYSRLKALAPEQETRDKLTSFIRSRWFHPPFSGSRFTSWILEACKDMEGKAPENGSLLPDGHPLDLYVSLTDFYGHANRIALHDPPVIEERDHRHVLQFGYVRSREGRLKSDFGPEHVPGLAFAARATSSFPGAFEPMSVAELDRALARMDMTWSGRDEFLRTKLGKFMGRESGEGIDEVRFIDGSVVNDKPFAAAAGAISGRPAQRSVMRRIIFVDPNPIDAVKIDETGDPGFFRTILASLAEIPRNEPIHDDLERISSLNRNIRLIGQVLQQSRPQVDHFVDGILPRDSAKIHPTESEIAQWRNAANEQAASGAGYAFHNYFRLKILRTTRKIESLIASMAYPDSGGEIPPHARLGFMAALGKLGVLDQEFRKQSQNLKTSTREIQFLKTFDVDFRVRRLRFVIRRLNELYRVAASNPQIESQVDRLDELKTTLYGLLEQTKMRWQAAYHGDEIAQILNAVAEGADPGPEIYEQVIDRIGKNMALQEADSQADEIFAVMVLNYIPEALRRDLFAAYVGFSFFDVMSFPMVQWEDIDEFEEILIDRISPADAKAIRTGGTPEILKGVSLRRFGAFFNRSYRENDYLWGRLNAADRLVDIIMGAVSESDIVHDIDCSDFKRRLFHAILDAEEPFLKADPDLISTIRREVDATD